MKIKFTMTNGDTHVVDNPKLFLSAKELADVLMPHKDVKSICYDNEKIILLVSNISSIKIL